MEWGCGVEMLWGCGVEMMWGCGSQPVALPPSLGSHTHSNILKWSCSIWFIPPYAQTHLYSFVLRSGKVFLFGLNKLIFQIHTWISFCRTKRWANHVQKLVWSLTVTNWFDLFKISQLFWRDFILSSLKCFRFVHCNLFWLSNFRRFCPQSKFGRCCKQL